MRNLLWILIATPALGIIINASTSTPTSMRYEQASSTVRYSADWYPVKRGYCSNGSAIAAMTAGDSATLTFTGSAVRWIGYKDEWSGIASVYLDGQFRGTVDTYASPSQAQTGVWEVSGLTSTTTHTVKIVVQGTRNPASASTWVWVDAFDVTP